MFSYTFQGKTQVMGYGVLCDRFGTWKATMAVLAVVAASLLCFLFV